ncbi:SURF2 Surfeit locus protein 2 [uncultured Adlercreutzia sp.]|uniref:SURF2 Surfeit locus protein 2 n=1 Tax=uncultured Adlercreutzia sp. TaxID=875803 RepID=UPI0025E337D0|nr:SURF2 Surfeit locus protein 2 [uncultured Adlercreutzia sp.]
MADPQGFSHITVTAADDDDIVIQAGIVEPAEPELELEPELEPEQEPEPEPEPEAAPSDGYHETTLADLESVKMSRAQKAVIVVALLGIIAFVAWYLLAR